MADINSADYIEPFLSSEKVYHHLAIAQSKHSAYGLQENEKKSKRRWTAVQILFHGVLVMIYTLVFLKSKRSSVHENIGRQLHSPAYQSLKYEMVSLKYSVQANAYSTEDYSGGTKEGLSEAWDKLLANLYIRVSAADVAKTDPGVSLALNDGSGYLSSLQVYHELHCVRQLQIHLTWTEDHPNATIFEKQLESDHIAHCLEVLREAAMCRADISLRTYFWSTEHGPTSRVYNDHECVDWNRLDTWAGKRRVDIEDVSPESGPAR